MTVDGVPGVGGDGDQEAVHHEDHHRDHVVKLEDAAVNADLVQMKVLGHFLDLVTDVIVHSEADLILSFRFWLLLMNCKCFYYLRRLLCVILFIAHRLLLLTL